MGVCTLVPKKTCKTVIKIVPETKCTLKPKESCKDVPVVKSVPTEELECNDEVTQVPVQKPVQDCKNVVKQVPVQSSVTECNDVPVSKPVSTPRQKCSNVPKQVCQQVAVQKPKQSCAQPDVNDEQPLGQSRGSEGRELYGSHNRDTAGLPRDSLESKPASSRDVIWFNRV